MTGNAKKQKIFFVINPGSGSNNELLPEEITTFYKGKPVDVELFKLPKKCSKAKIAAAIEKANADKVVAVGGDGTLKLVAESLVGTTMPIGIIPTGSANGMAKELEIPMNLKDALEVVYTGKVKQIHVVMVNNELCIHLADIGFNAYIVKKFDELPERGMWTYAKAAWIAFWNHRKMDVEFTIDNKTIRQKAAMVAIANATKYGSGLQINPKGKLDDELFEVIIVKEYAVMEIIKIWISNLPWNSQKIEIFQTNELKINTKHRVHFQVDGEYLGKTTKVEARIIPSAIHLILPN